MLVRAYNPLSADKPKFSQNLRGIVDKVISFSYTRRAYDIGSFEMTIPSSEEAKQIIVPGVIIIAGDVIKYSYIVETTQKTISNNAFYVTSVTDTDNETMHITGYDLKYLLSFRITLFPQEEQDKGTYGYYVTKGDTFHCVSELIDYNLTNASDEKRRIYGFGRLVMPTAQIEAGLTGIADDRYMTRLEPLSTAVFNLLKNCKTHFWEVRVMIDEQSDQPDGYVPRMESGEDKTPLIITPDLYNISAYDKTEDVSAYKNVLYAVSNDGSSTKALVQAVSKDTTSDSGITRKEVVVDVDAESIEDIPTYALKSGEEYEIADDFEVTPIFDDDDTLLPAQPVVVKLGTHTYTSIITEITDEYSDNGHTCSFVVGNKKIKVLNVLNKAIASTNQKTINNKLVLSGAANIDTAIVLQERELQSVVHNYTEIGYISGNSVGYGDTPNTIICNGVLINGFRNRDYQNGPKYKYLSFPKGHSFNAPGVSARIESVTDIVVDVAVEVVYEDYKKLRSQITVTDAGNGGRAGYTLTRFSVDNGEDYAVFPYWNSISPPSEDYPYGSVQIFFDTIVCEDGVWNVQSTQFGAYLYVSFASEAEYNAAIGLTNTPIELIELKDFQYLVPESQIIVDKELSEGSDNVIANSTVAKALSLKAEKSEVQSISQAVEGKAEQSEVTALSEDYNASKTDFDTRIRKLATTSTNHGRILNEHADELLLKADKTEVSALQSDVTELQKSRRNYIYNSAFLYGSDGWVFDTNCAVDKTRLYNCHPTVKLNQTGLSAAAYNGVSSTALPIKDKSEMKSGELWNFSCKYYAEDISTIDQPILFQIQGIAEGATALSVIAQRSVAADGITAGEWQEMSFSFTPAQNYSACLVNCFLIQNGVLWFADFKLEKNNKPTEWIPAYEDAGMMAERIATLEAALLSLQ